MRSVKLLFGVLIVVLISTGIASRVGVASGDISEENVLFLPLVMVPCWPSDQPVGALPGQPAPVFCTNFSQGPDTSQAVENSWLDAFDHGLSFANFSQTGYRLFETVGYVHETLHWRHADHWMVDLASHSPGGQSGEVRGGGLMRPDRSFRFEDGKFVVEVDVAAGIEAYETNAWPEIVISTGETPHDIGSLYAYDMFPEDWTIGCRLQATRYPVCSFKANDGNLQAGTGSERIWEMSAHQDVGTTNFGGSPFEGRDAYWHLCGATDPDAHCRDRFRLELTRTSLTLYVNGHRYFEQTGIPPLPEELLSGDIYVYLASMAVSHPAETIRFHWDGISVNPQSPPSSVESPGSMGGATEAPGKPGWHRMIR